jgi:hypothetical protein
MDIRRIKELSHAKQVIISLQEQLASVLTTCNNKEAAFNLMTSKWHGQLNDLITSTQFIHDNDESSQTDLKPIIGGMKEVVGNIATVKQMGLNDLHDALLPPPPAGMTPAATGKSLTDPVLSSDIDVLDSGAVTVGNKPIALTPTAVDIESDEEGNQKQVIHNLTPAILPDQKMYIDRASYTEPETIGPEPETIGPETIEPEPETIDTIETKS